VARERQIAGALRRQLHANPYRERRGTDWRKFNL